MKKMMILALMMTIVLHASAMSYSQARREALYLSDKMAYELDLTDSQYDAVYEINLDYLLSLNGHTDVFGIWWNRRNNDLRYVLTPWQYDRFIGRTYFHRPVSWFNGSWLFNIYTHYVHRDKFYKPRPSVYVVYKGGNNKKHDRYYAERYRHPSTRGKGSVNRNDFNNKPQPSHQVGGKDKKDRPSRQPVLNEPSQKRPVVARSQQSTRSNTSLGSSAPARRSSSASTRSSNRNSASSTAPRNGASRNGGGRGSR